MLLLTMVWLVGACFFAVYQCYGLVKEMRRKV